MKYVTVFVLSVFIAVSGFAGGRGDDSDRTETAAEDVVATDDQPVVERTVPPNPVERPNADGVIVTHAISLRPNRNTRRTSAISTTSIPTPPRAGR